jgi:hypothetical protein
MRMGCITKSSSFAVQTIWENAFYGFSIMLSMYIIDAILVLTSSLYVGRNDIFIEFFLLLFMLAMFMVIIVYTIVDVIWLITRTLLFPYLITVLSILGIFIELSPHHPNRQYIDIVGGFLILYIILIALPIHFWRSTTELVKRNKLEENIINGDTYVKKDE